MDYVITFAAGFAVCFIIVYYSTHKEARDALFSRFKKKPEEPKP